MDLASGTETPPDSNLLSIAFVVDRFGARYGGAEAYGVELMRVFAKQGHKITVFARDYDKDCDLKLDFKQINIAKFWPTWLRVLIFAYKAARHTRNGYDVVHSHMNGWCGDIEVVHVTPVKYRWGIRQSGIFKKFLNFISPRVQTYRCLESKRFKNKPGHSVVAVSKLIAEQLQQAYKFDNNITIIPPGVTAAKILSDSDKADLRLGMGLPSGAIICLLVARNPIRKGLATAISALQNLPDNIHLLVVGANSASRNLVAQSNSNIQSKIHLIAETANVNPYYQLADIYIHPTLNDSFGMAPLEAMSFGLPVILSPAPWCGFADYVTAGKEALLLKDPKDHSELADLIAQLANNKDLKKQLISGSENVVKRHSWDEMASQYMKLYELKMASTK